jgi:hypothetical protein
MGFRGVFEETNRKLVAWPVQLEVVPESEGTRQSAMGLDATGLDLK